MDSFTKYLELGQKHGLKDNELWQFAENREKQEREREERHMKHELAKLQHENEQRAREAELEKLRIDRESVAKEKALQREHELAMAKLQKETDEKAKGATVTAAPKGPKLPCFDESKDSIDAYIRRFEVYAQTNKWNREHYASYLSSLLKGKALDVYSQMPLSDVNNYDRLKQNLLRYYQMTEDGYKKRFFTSRMETDEHCEQFLIRLNDYFNNWVELAGIEKNYEHLCNFIVVEQFLHVCPAEVAMHIREKELRSIAEVSHAAEVFMNVHKIKPKPLDKKHKPKPQTTEVSNVKPEASSKPKASSLVCFYCDKPGHKAIDCYSKKKASATAVASIEEYNDVDAYSDVVSTCLTTSSTHQCKTWRKKELNRLPNISSIDILPEDKEYIKRLPIVYGIVNSQQVRVLRDTGCTAAIIRKSLVKPSQFTSKKGRYISVDQTSRLAEFAELHIDCPFYTGCLEFMCIDEPICDVIIGNLQEVVQQPTDFLCKYNAISNQGKNNNSNSKVTQSTQASNDHGASAVTTRSQAAQQQKPAKTLKVSTLPELGSKSEFKAQQQRDPTLHQARKWVEIKKIKTNENTKEAVTFVSIQGLLYRKTYSTETGNETKSKQLLVPRKHRTTVMKLGHESIMAGHMGINKTTERIQSNFYWPGMYDDINRYCKSCDVCQRTVPRGTIPKAPLGTMPIINVPFQRVAIDLIGPLHPISARKHQYILTLVDMATRYPKAIPLVKIDSATVADALISMFSDTGVPKEILSDRGTQFTSETMNEVNRLLSIKAIHTTPYHAQCNGLCERYNGTLKQMLRRMIQEQPKEWDRFIEPLLFAYREAPVDSLGGFSPFELLYGRTVRGPMSILRECWTNEQIEDNTRDLYGYVLNLREKLEETCKISAEALRKSQVNQKNYFDKKAVPRTLKPGDEVLLLLPTDHNKLLMTWKGPYSIVDRIGLNNYSVQLDNSVKVFHINMLKQYFRRNDSEVNVAIAAISFENDNPDQDAEQLEVLGPIIKPTEETYKDVNINPNLTAQQTREMKDLIEEYKDIFSSRPGVTNLGEHKIVLTDDEPIRCKPYPVPYALYADMEKEIKSMLEMGIIEPSDSPYNSPIVIVKKKDGTARYCQDMRQVNKVTRFDCEPIPDINAIYAKCANDKYFSKIDCCKGYWQIPLEEKSKEITAFSTPFGHYQYRMMTFGLMNSGSTFHRVMRKLTKDLSCIDNFVDDILDHTAEWQQQLDTLRALFERIRAAKLKVRPSKCYFGYTDIEFTGHHLCGGNLKTQRDKIEKIRAAPAPTTKKQLRSFLGLSTYYRDFIPHFAAKVKPLTDLTQKNVPDRLIWTEEHESAFRKLKEELSSDPILKLPDINKPFVLRTDACDTGLGAVLMQQHDDRLFPVAYASKKLLPRERNYSIMEKECLAVVWAIDKFKLYLYGKEFTLQTDHQSLAYLNKAKFNNQRVMRWSLALQPYKFHVEYIKGEDNLGADFLSRV